MRSIFSVTFIAAALAAPSAFGQASPQLNHLDCRWDESTQDIVCPAMPTGRAAAEPVAPTAQSSAPARSGQPAPGTPEWNAACAAKYRSFNPETGMYKSFSGQMRPCK